MQLNVKTFKFRGKKHKILLNGSSNTFLKFILNAIDSKLQF